MNAPNDPADTGDPQLQERRAFLTRAAGIAAIAAGGPGLAASAAAPAREVEPFWGAHQAGIATPAQAHLYFAAFDLTAVRRDEVASLLRVWTAAAAAMTAGQTAAPLDGPPPIIAASATPADGAKRNDAAAGSDAAADDYAAAGNDAAAGNHGGRGGRGGGATVDVSTQAGDSAEALGLSPARLTVTFGFGTGLFLKDGKDRYGLAAQRPEALVDLPKFPGDQLVAEQTGGDLMVQACADDPQVAFHAVRQLARLAVNVAKIRWVQIGFRPGLRTAETPRNLMGFKDGTGNVPITDAAAMSRFVWIGREGPDWMQEGSYLVARRIRVAVEHWDRMKVTFQEQTIGRHKYSGAPLGQKGEFAPLNLDATDTDGNPVIPENSHVRLATATSNDGARILRRPYSYNNGVDLTAERWPPWHQGLEYDAGLFFVAYQRDPRAGFIKLFDKMSRFDMLNQFVTHVGGGLYACPRGADRGEYIGQRLFEAV